MYSRVLKVNPYLKQKRKKIRLVHLMTILSIRFKNVLSDLLNRLEMPNRKLNQFKFFLKHHVQVLRWQNKFCKCQYEYFAVLSWPRTCLRINSWVYLIYFWCHNKLFKTRRLSLPLNTAIEICSHYNASHLWRFQLIGDLEKNVK